MNSTIMKLVIYIRQCFGFVWFWIVYRTASLLNRFFYQRHCVPQVVDEILLHSASRLAAKIRSQELTSAVVVSAYISRIKAVNPLINALVENRFEEALKEAAQVDAQIQAGVAPSVELTPFLGVPFTTKDSIFVHGMLCTAGILVRKNIRMFKDADVVKLLKDAGAICLGLTNVSENVNVKICMWWESNNTIYGRSNNPYDTRRIVGGSSGGEGALIGSGSSVFGIGADVGGSIRMPCYFNGIFGHKPTRFVVSVNGTIPSPSGYQTQMLGLGPMCRYAEDLTPMLKVLAGPSVNRLKLDEDVTLSELKIFYMTEIKSCLVAPPSTETREILVKVLDYFVEKHNVVSFKVDLPLVHWAIPIWLNDMTVIGSPKFTEELLDHQGDFNPFLEVATWACGASKHTAPAIGLAMLERLLKNCGSEEERAAARSMRTRLQREFAELLGENGVFLFPSHPTPAPFHNVPIYTPMNFAYTALFNSLALPVTQVPLGLNAEGVPLGIQVVAGYHNDHLGLAIARELEKGFGGWVNPGTVY